ncbi:MAG: choice-of-anchor I family protein, partial [Nostocales cyanobacterium 94392]|nr:choice-of-anchor I family protein [Nostocales cyanobacterium 94392]
MATTLSAGDIAIIGVNADNPDNFSFVLLVDIEAGTEIRFTDSGWTNSNAFRASEGAFKYTAPTNLSAGTVINFINNSANFAADNDAGVGTNGFNLSTDGDQVIAFQGASTNPTFIYAVQTNSTQFQTTATTSNDSALPNGLVSGTSAVAVGQGSGAGDEWDNSVYNMSVTSGTKEEILAAVSNPVNWTGSNDALTIPTSSFTIGGSSNNDTTPPELNAANPLTPADDATNAVIDADLTIKFNESVQKGTGNILIKNSSDGSVVETFDVATSTAITVSGDTVTINPTNNLAASTGFYVEIDAGAIEDAAGNDFAGISGNSTWNFTTGTEDSITPIYDIQGAAHTSPLVGQSVTTTGIVTAVDTNGFYLQDSTGDDNNATSDAIFVFTSSAPTVTVGDDVEVSGTVSEFFPGGVATGNLSTTQISGSPTVTIKSSGNTLPAATIIGTGGRIPPTENIDDDAFTSFDPNTDGIDFFESLEAMLVTAKDAVAVAGTNGFGEIFAVVDDGTGATGISQRGTLNISPDDFNPERVQINQDTGILPGFTLPQVDVGANLGDVTGVVGYGFGNFEIYPTQSFTGTPATIQPETTTIESDADKLTVASYNVLNLDPNDADGDTDIADGRFSAIATQIVSNLKAPDIIGLQEVQDNTGSTNDGVTAADQTLQRLVDAIAAAGGPTYSFIDNTFIGNNTSGGQPGGNIRTAFLYNPDRVNLVDGSVATIQDVAFNGSRLPLVAKFTFNDEEVTVVNNHFSSKGGSAPILGVQQPFEARQEEVAVNGSLDERQAQAQAVKGYVDGILAADANANVVVVGDLNEFEFVSPVTTLAQSLTNLTETVPENERYSFIFQGNSQSLDHILVSDKLTGKAEFDIVHLNSEFAETTQRASDHDPLVASLSIPKNMDIPKINLSKIGTFTSEDGAEIVAHDPTSQRLFVTTGDTVEIIDISNPASPTKFAEIDITSIGGGVNSVAVKNGIVAVAVEANNPQELGVVAFFDADGNSLRTPITVGALPDMLTFTPDGTKILVANEGEPNEDYTVDPEGSISIIDVSGGIANASVTTAGFTGFNDQKQALIDSGVRIFGPGATVAQDLEPEYIAVSADGTKAFVTLQENNAIAVLDVATATVEDILPLGYKDHNLPGNGLDASDRDVDGSSGGGGKINIKNWPVFGMYQPDSIASFEADGKTYYLTANEGDARIRPTGDDILPAPNDGEGDIFNEEVRIGSSAVVLDPTAFPNAAELKNNANLGRLLITNTLGDTDGDGDYDKLYAYGTRSFSIWDDQGNLVFDSGDQLERITAELTPEFFNANNGATSDFDTRSDNKGPEPEAATVGVINGKPYGFVGLERAGGGVMVYDLSNPAAPKFVQYIRTEGDISPEGFKFISAAESPNGNPVLAVANEVSGTTTLYNIDVQPTITNYTFDNLPKLGTTSTNQDIFLGGFSGLYFQGIAENGNLKFVTHTDRGPNGEPTDGKRPFLLPDFQPEVVSFELNRSTGEIAITNRTGLFREDGTTPLTGLPNLQSGAANTAYTDEIGVDLNGNTLANDTLGADLEGIVVAQDGSFWMVDEYRPAIYHFENNGKLIERFIPEGSATDSSQNGGTSFGTPVLPAVYAQRRANRGFEAVALEGNKLYAFIQSPIDNPDNGSDTASRSSRNLRILEFDTVSKEVTGEYLYLLDDITGSGNAKTDKIGDAVALGNGKFAVVERDDLSTTDSNKLIYSIDLAEATNINNPANFTLPAGKTIEQLTPEELTTANIKPATKSLIANAAEFGYTGVEKLEGLALVAPNTLALINDNDFNSDVPQKLGILELPKDLPVTTDQTFTLQLLHAADQEAGVPALDDAPRFSAVLNALKNQDADGDGNVDYENTILLSSGDAYIPGLFFDAAADPTLAPLLGKEGKGRADIAIQNELGFQAIAFGNHEFDFGTAQIKSLLAPDGDYPGANFPYLSSNLDFSNNTDLAPLVAADGQEASTIPGKIAKSTVVTVNGEKIGVVGATTPTLPRISSPGTVGVLPADSTDINALAAEIQKSVDALLAANPELNKVVLLSHMQQIAIEEQLAGLLKNVDIIMAGGSNTRLVDETDRLRAGDTAQGEYPIIKTDADGKPVAVINTDGNYKYVGRLVVDFDAQGNIITDSIDPTVSGAYATDDEGVAALNAENLVDPEIKAITDALRKVIQEQDGNVLGITDVFLNGARQDVRTQETNLGNLT